MDNKITITVTGGLGSGKTTLATEIFLTLLGSGLNVQFEDDEIFSTDIQPKRLEALVEKRNLIIIETKQTAREE